jgi:glycosyltransferase involved in cell wall biosynthesis
MIRILHFVSSINVNSGIMSLLMNYYRNADTKKIQFDFIYFIKNETQSFQTEIEELGGRCFFVSPPNKYPKKFFKDMKNYYSSHYGEYLAAHIHDIFMPSFLLSCKKRLGVKKIILHAHLTVFGYSKTKAIRNYLLSIPRLFIVDEYWACSRDAGESLFGKKFHKNGRVINNAISLEKFVYKESVREEIKRSLSIENCYVVGHVGWFNPQKNHTYIIEIFKNVVAKKKNARLILIGDGEYKNEIEQECKKKSIEDKVLFLGVRDDVNRIMNAFDVFLFPSKYEGLGIALIEAQSLGIPCVFSDTIPEEANVLAKQNRIFSLDDPIEMWTDAVINANRNYENPHECLRRAGFDIKTESKKIVDYYKQGL